MFFSLVICSSLDESKSLGAVSGGPPCSIEKEVGEGGGGFPSLNLALEPREYLYPKGTIFWPFPYFSKKSHIFRFLSLVTTRLQHLNVIVFLFSLVGKRGWKCWKWYSSSKGKATTWSPQTSSYWFQCGIPAISGKVKC